MSLLSLKNHCDQYLINRWDLLSAVAKGCSGAPYAKRHWELAHQEHLPRLRLGHRIIAIVEYTPIIGAIAAIFERLVIAIVDLFQNHRRAPVNNECEEVIPENEDLDEKIQEQSKEHETEINNRPPSNLITETSLSKEKVEATKSTTQKEEDPLATRKKSILEKLAPFDKDNFNISEQDLDAFFTFEQNVPKIHTSKKAKHYRKKTTTNPCNRSIVVNQNGECVILLKTQKKRKPIGMGAFNRVTYCFNLKTEMVMAYRSGAEENVGSGEIKAHRLLSNNPDLFAAGEVVKYLGNVSRRKEIKLKNIEKIGIIMPLCDSDIEKITNNGTYKNLRDEIKRKIITGIATALDCLHRTHKLVHHDLKRNNVLITKDYAVKLSDFGTIQKMGNKDYFEGSAAYLSPEALASGVAGKNYHSLPNIDMWAFGMLLAEMKYGKDAWKSLPNDQKNRFKKRAAFLKNLKDTKGVIKEVLPKYKDSKNLDSLIYECLRHTPEKRITARDFLKKLKAITVF